MRGNVPANIQFCFPPMHGLGAMHSKLQLLKYPNRLRVVIPTGNLVPYDWGETGVMENVGTLRILISHFAFWLFRFSRLTRGHSVLVYI